MFLANYTPLGTLTFHHTVGWGDVLGYEETPDYAPQADLFVADSRLVIRRTAAACAAQVRLGRSCLHLGVRAGRREKVEEARHGLCFFCVSVKTSRYLRGDNKPSFYRRKKRRPVFRGGESSRIVQQG